MSPALTLNSTLNSPLGESTGLSSNVPLPYQVAINGRGYLVDLSFQPWKRQAMRTTSIDPTRTQADTSNEPGEQTLNPEALWRRSQDTWTDGAGQTNLDRKESDIAMFRSSKGIDVWTLWQATLLPDTAEIYTSTTATLLMAEANGYLYVADGQKLYYVDTPTAATVTSDWTQTSSTPSDAISSICSDGETVYIACGSGGIYSASGTGAASQYVSSAVDSAAVVGYANGRLMVGSTNVLYNVTGSGALPTALMTAGNSNFRWVGFAEGNGFIYAAGNAGSKGYLYAITIAADGSALSAPIIAGQLPTGETITSVTGYLGYIVIGTTRGFRVATTASTSTGILTIGPLVAIPSAVKCLDGQDRFVWFGWTDFDTSSTGLGRMDLTKFPVVPQAPAYASDLMSPSGSTVQGTVQSVTWVNDLHVFSVGGKGVYVENDSTVVPSGWIESGLITYDIADNKLPVYFDVLTNPLVGSISASVALQGGSYQSLGTVSVADTTFTEFQAPQTLCSWMETKITLTANSAATAGPTLIRTTMRSIPATVTGSNIFVPIRLHPRLDLSEGGPPLPCDVGQELAILESLRLSKQIVTYQEGTRSLSVYVADLDWIPEQVMQGGTFAGVCVVNLKEPV